MKILWVSNAPWYPSGYGVQTGLVCPRLKQMAHDVTIAANCGIGGAAFDWKGITVFPQAFGNQWDMVEHYRQKIGADIVISFYDIWPMEPEKFADVWVPWTPIDKEPFAKAVMDKGELAMHMLTCSQFGQKACEDYGMDSSYVPCAIDTSVFRPTDRAKARNALEFPDDVFVVGMVADNNGYPSRKALPQHLEAFARFHKRHPDTMLYLHTCAGSERGGPPLGPLIDALGILDCVRIAPQEEYQMGMGTEHMVSIYNAIDVLAAVSMDEGFGVPLVEAQACGTPVITGEWTSMGELAEEGYTVRREEAEPWYNPTVGGWQYLAHVDAISEGMDSALEYEYTGEVFGQNKRRVDFAAQYDIEHVMDAHWKPALERVESILGAEGMSV